MNEAADTPRKLPVHLGGHKNVCHTDAGSLDWAWNRLNARSMIDVGCGTGGQVKLAQSLGWNAIGIDGDYTVGPDIIHDYTNGPLTLDQHFDLTWSVEFLEHIEEKFLPHYMETFKGSRFIVCTAAPPGKNGYHHVNCKDLEYWIEQFALEGFRFDQTLTDELKAASTMKRGFVRTRGMVFQKG